MTVDLKAKLDAAREAKNAEWYCPNCCDSWLMEEFNALADDVIELVEEVRRLREAMDSIRLTVRGSHPWPICHTVEDMCDATLAGKEE